MGPAPRSEGLRAEATARYVESALEEADRTRSSALWVVSLTAVVATLWHLDAQRGQSALKVLLALWWLVAVASSIAVRLTGSTRWVRGLAVLEEVVGAWASVVAVFASAPPLVSPVWLVTVARSFAWLPRRGEAVLAGRWGRITAHLALAGWWAGTEHLSGAAIILALLATQMVVLEISTQLVRQRLELAAEAEGLHVELESLQMRQENDRIARELHDGLGAELVALMLSLRGKGPSAEAHTRQVLNLLEELRSVVWALRGGRGSFSEFEKLLCARARMTVSAHVVASSELRDRAAVVEPDAAIAILAAVHEVLSKAAALAGLSDLRISLEARPTLAVTLHFPGAPSGTIAALLEGTPAAPGSPPVSVVLIDAGAGLRIALG